MGNNFFVGILAFPLDQDNIKTLETLFSTLDIDFEINTYVMLGQPINSISTLKDTFQKEWDLFQEEDQMPYYHTPSYVDTRHNSEIPLLYLYL